MSEQPEIIYAASVESTLGFADAPVDELRDRLLRAQRYTFSWLKAVASSVSAIDPTGLLTGNASVFDAAGAASKIRAMQSTLSAVLDMMPPSDIYPGKSDVAAYEAASHEFAELYRELISSMAGYPARPLLDELGDLPEAFIRAPFAAAKTAMEELAQQLKELLGATFAAVWSKLWPFLLLGGAVGLVYVFRAPIGRAVGKVAE